MKAQTPARPTFNPATFLQEKLRLAAEMSHARTDEEREAIRAEYKALAEEYRQWHLRTYGWAYAAY